ncbi:head-tail adaptor protein [Acuticoccus sediminis]|uniref:Head-tail adaptor protein n=1 Tax=Acuticoccus sediminis TaxID=2184697 RepID=A0A8B2NM88_9HYPH|nr:phage head closure protein [Acuticoccus sediminis]RAH97615.1 head-tail adaptor protein [Acuticoccus sediminis]
MITSGQLDKIIEIKALTQAQDEYGAISESWATFATVHAQRLETRTSDFLRASGEGSETVAAFRIRWRPDVSVADRLSCNGDNFEIIEVVELGRRRALELRCRGRV